jgi:hypothetical protein
MPIAKIIVGLCECGKSHMAEGLEAPEGYVCLGEKFEGKCFAADTGALFRGKFDTLVRLLKEGKDFAYTDAMLMDAWNRRQFDPWLKELRAMKGVTVEWVFFENDLATANHSCLNDHNRKDPPGSVANNNLWSPHYTIPVGHTLRPITRITPIAEAVRRRAYELWEKRGREANNDWTHWFQARQEHRIPDGYHV